MKLQLFLTGLFGVLAAASQAQTWDLAGDFSTTTNPNGAWNYGKYDGSGIFSLNADAGGFFGFGTGWVGDGGSGRPFVGKNTSGSTNSGALPGQVFVHPDYGTGAHPFAGIHWVAPVNGIFDVSVTFYAGDSNTVNEFVSIDRASYLGTQSNVSGDWTLTFTQAMSAGEFLDFFVGPNSTGDVTSTTTPMDIHIVNTSSVPEPASCAGLALGLAVLVRRRKRS